MTASSQRYSSRKNSQLLKAVVVYTVIAVFSMITILPFLWMIITSLKEPTEAMVPPNSLAAFIPNPPIFDNYTYLFDPERNRLLPFGNFVFNSVYISIVVVIGRLLVCAAGGYGFARLEFPGKALSFGMLIASMMIPSMVTIFPLFSIYKSLGWIDTHWPLIVSPIVANTFGTFLMRQFFMTIPRELEEAAICDGATQFGVFWRIFLPLSKPILATLAIFTFQGTWNSFFEPLIFVNKVKMYTIPLGLAFFNAGYATEYAKLMAGSMLALLPILLVYTFAQQYFTTGITLTGISGYLAYVELTRSAVLCGPIGNCDVVQTSEYAIFLGVPVAIWGALGYAGVLFLWLARRFTSGALSQQATAASLALLIVAALFSVYLTLIELFVLHAICTWCVSSAIVVTLLLVLTASEMKQVPALPPVRRPSKPVRR